MQFVCRVLILQGSWASGSEYFHILDSANLMSCLSEVNPSELALLMLRHFYNLILVYLNVFQYLSS